MVISTTGTYSSPWFGPRKSARVGSMVDSKSLYQGLAVVLMVGHRVLLPCK
jgi:hypothetical protein